MLDLPSDQEGCDAQDSEYRGSHQGGLYFAFSSEDGAIPCDEQKNHGNQTQQKRAAHSGKV